ncbi:hypothetical protein FOCC_FOCC015229 [Frankliniella occidentalis]|nr:hypothetical protein FOCC_FOCC015229 [Frankliniella occidentalis]
MTTKAKGEKSREGVERKRYALGEALMYAARPKTYIPPLLCALTTDLYSRLWCRDEIDILNSFGLLVSYHEAKRHAFSVAMFKRDNEGRECEVQRAPRVFAQYAFDNFDHDTSTLDGHDTVHVLGGQRIVALVDPTAEIKVDCIPRRPLPSSTSQIAQDLNYTMKIVWLTGPALNGLTSVLVQPMTSTCLSWDTSGPSLPPFIGDALTLDLLWMAGRWAGALLSAPSWLGYMKWAMTAPDRVLPLSTVQALPFVELAASDPNAINSALHYAKKDVEDRGQKDYCFVTFDQPLYMKAM